MNHHLQANPYPANIPISGIWEPEITFESLKRIPTIRALLGFFLLLLGLTALVAFILLLIIQKPIFGIVFGISSATFLVVARLGAKYAHPEPRSQWRAIKTERRNT